MNKQILTKSILRQLIKEEVAKQTQTKLNENPLQFIMDNPESLAGLMAFLGIGAATAKTAVDKFKAAASDKEKQSILKRAFSAVRGAAGDTVSGIEKATGANTMGQGIGGSK